LRPGCFSGESAFPRVFYERLWNQHLRKSRRKLFAISRSETKRFKSIGICTCRKWWEGFTRECDPFRVGASLPIRLQSAKVM
jgi:hypothetical protein